MSEDKNPQVEIDSLRDEIDRTDREILALLNKRAGLAGRIGDVKKASGKNFYVPGREDKLVPFYSERLGWRTRDEEAFRKSLERIGPKAARDYYGSRKK